MKEFKIITLHLPPIGTNCYIVSSGEAAFVIDPASCADKIIEKAASEGIKICAILLTHGHYDHIGAVDELSEKTGCKIYVHSLDTKMLSDPSLNVSLFFGQEKRILSKATEVNDGNIITVGDAEITVMHTPGHTAGSACYICGDDVFTGDTLFFDGYGRTDLPTGDIVALEKSLKRLAGIVEKKKIHPGH